MFNNDWYVVGLHHAGVPEKQDGAIQRNPDGSTKWIANEGIRASRIVQTLKQAQPNHPLLLPLYAATPTSARITSAPTDSPISSPLPRETPMVDTRTISIPLEIRLQMQTDGQVGSIAVATRQGTESIGAADATLFEKTAKPAGK